MNKFTTENENVLTVKELSKIYALYSNPLDRFKEFFTREKKHTDFVALDRASFALKRGETLGVIGENGSGKSTLLQLIAGTLTPTSGEVKVKGSVLALLELGVGFHPDFTGRENIFFYGETLGYQKDFIQSKLNEIIEFSELESFIDWPLQTYSTGMQMRLAFSFISSLEPDILIIDEALSVGDMHFQKKCIDRIIDFKQKGKTIIFCSHSTYQTSIICNTVIWLKDGRIEMGGEAEKVIPAYEFYQLGKNHEKQKKYDKISLSSDHPVLIRDFNILNKLPFKRGEDLKFRLLVESARDDLPYHVTLSIKMDNGRGVYVTGTHLSGKKPLSGKMKEIIITYPNVPIMGGVYYSHARIFDDKGLLIYHESMIPSFEVQKDSQELGVCYFDNHWEVR
jgi:lipopolysaccharide transport system ATP-binding protein